MINNSWLSVRYMAPTIVAIMSGVLVWFGGTAFSAFEVLAAIVGLFTLGHAVVTDNFKKLLPHSRLDYLVLMLVVLLVLPVLYSQTVDWLFAAITVYLLSVYWFTKYWREIRPVWLVDVVKGYLVAAVIFAGFGIFQYLLAVFGYDGSGFVYEVRWHGLLDDPVVFGAMLVPAVILFGYQAVYTTNCFVYWRYVLLSLLCFVGLILTGSRGAWLNLLVAGVVLVLLEPSLWQGYRLWNSLRLIVLAFGLAAIIIFIVPINGRTYYSATLEHRFTASDGPRIENIQEASTSLQERSVTDIILGSGSGSYEVFSTDGFSAHNTYLRVLFEQGVVGICLFALLLYWRAKRALTRRIADNSKSVFDQYQVVILAILIGILVQSLFVDTLHWRHFWLLLAFI